MESAALAVRRAEIEEARVGLLTEALLERARDPRLADTRFAREQDDTALALPSLSPAAQQQLDLFLTPDQRRQAPRAQRLETALDGTGPDHLPRTDRLGKAL